MSLLHDLMRLLAQEHTDSTLGLSQSEIHRGIVDYLVDRQPPLSEVIPSGL